MQCTTHGALQNRAFTKMSTHASRSSAASWSSTSCLQDISNSPPTYQTISAILDLDTSTMCTTTNTRPMGQRNMRRYTKEL